MKITPTRLFAWIVWLPVLILGGAVLVPFVILFGIVEGMRRLSNQF